MPVGRPRPAKARPNWSELTAANNVPRLPRNPPGASSAKNCTTRPPPTLKSIWPAPEKPAPRPSTKIIGQIAARVGVRQFETLPFHILKRSRAPVLKYVMAKKYFRKKKYQRALNILKRSVPSGSPVKPFALFWKPASTASKKDTSCPSTSTGNASNEPGRKCAAHAIKPRCASWPSTAITAWPESPAPSSRRENTNKPA